MIRIIDIVQATVPVPSPGRNAVIDFSRMTASVVAIITNVIRDGQPVVGFGFNSNGRYGAGGLLSERIIPRLIAAGPQTLHDDSGENLDPARAWSVMMADEKPGGHGERSVAVGVVDMALWDTVAKIEERPLYQLLADRYHDGKVDTDVFVYAAGGYYHDGKGVQALADELRRYMDQGYSVVKIKIGGTSLSQDLRRIEAALGVVGHPDSLAVDANARFDPPTAIAYAEALAPYRLRWYEEPVDPLDYQGHARVAERYEHPLATGENLFSMVDARNLVRHGGLRPDQDILQFDCALSYGLIEYLRTLSMLRSHGWNARSVIPHGGHQMSLNIAAGLGLGGNESYPEVFQPFGGFADANSVVDSRVELPDVPGIGFEAKSDLYAVLRDVLNNQA